MREVRSLNYRLTFAAILPDTFKAPLKCHEKKLWQLEQEVYTLLAKAENAPVIKEVDGKTYYQKGMEIEKKIEDIQTLCEFNDYIKNLKKAIYCYNQAIDQGFDLASSGLKRVASHYGLFSEFAGKCLQGDFIDIKTFKRCFIECKYPLKFQDSRIDALFHFLIQMSAMTRFNPLAR